jgi:hypothetical protein
MFSLQEISQNDKIKSNLKLTEQFMDRYGYFDPKECNIFKGLDRNERHELSETLKHLSFKEWMTSTGLSTGFAGAGGINYLMPTYISMKLGVSNGSMRDIAPQIAGLFIEDQAGDTVNFAALATAYTPKTKGGLSGGSIIVNGSSTTTQRFSSDLTITNEMLEDTNYPLMEAAVQAARLSMIQQSNDQLLTVLARATPSSSQTSKQTATAGADTTTPAHIAAIVAQVSSCLPGTGNRKANTLVCTPETWWDAIITTAGHPEVHPGIAGFDAWYGALDTEIVHTDLTTGNPLGTWASNRLTNAVTIVLDRDSAIGVSRKNWMRIENYSDPVKDLAGALVTGKQACSELVCAAIGVLTES